MTYLKRLELKHQLTLNATIFHAFCFEFKVTSDENEPRICFRLLSTAVTKASISTSLHLGALFF